MEVADSSVSTLSEGLARQGYWPAWAVERLSCQKFSEVVQLCRERLATDPHLLSGRLAYALALWEGGQTEAAREQAYSILTVDPDHHRALKLLGDIVFSQGDEITAFAYYERVLELDPDCCGIACRCKAVPQERTHVITLTRSEEQPVGETVPLRSIPFYTETMGDLYLAQGYPRLAATVFRVLHERNRHPRFLEKLAQAEEKAKSKS